MATLVNKTYTIEEYLQQEEQADVKNEYFDGQIIPMAGGTTNHNQIAGNIYTELNIAFKRLDYRVYIGDVRLWIPDRNRFTYPDIMVVQGSPVYWENRTDTIVNPHLILEVLSPSTQDYDREGKFSAYRTLNSFQEYVLISQTQIYGERFVKTEDKKWLFQEYSEEDQQIELQLQNIALTFADIYHKVNLSH